ncbi:MAG: ATP-binding protein [Phototrophicaceae bacterium]
MTTLSPNIYNETQRWRTLYEITRALYVAPGATFRDTLQNVLEQIGRFTGLSLGCVMTFRENGVLNDAFTLDTLHLGNTLWEHLFNKGLIGYVYHGARTIIIRDIQHDPRFPMPPAGVPAPTGGSAIGIPLMAEDKAIGVMVFLHPNLDAIPQTMQLTLESAAEMIVQAIRQDRYQRTHQDTNERYQWLFDEAITPILFTDSDGQVITANREACHFLGYPLEEIRALKIREIHTPSQKKNSQTGETNLKTNFLNLFETQVKHKSGEVIPVRLKMRKRTFKDQAVIEYVMQDMRAEVELTQLRTDLTAMIFHDLRAPLQNMRFSLATLQKLSNKDPRSEKIFANANSSIDQMARMVSNLLDVQRLEGGSPLLSRKMTPVRPLLASVIAQTSAIVEGAGMRLQVHVPEQLPEMYADEEMLRRVLSNLIENATKYAQPGGVITVRVFQDRAMLHFAVADNGPGIPAEMRDRIFEKFSRVKYNDAPHGVGLGLTFCRMTVDAHGGSIWVESELGHGAQFHFTIPTQAG